MVQDLRRQVRRCQHPGLRLELRREQLWSKHPRWGLLYRPAGDLEHRLLELQLHEGVWAQGQLWGDQDAHAEGSPRKTRSAQREHVSGSEGCQESRGRIRDLQVHVE